MFGSLISPGYLIIFWIVELVLLSLCEKSSLHLWPGVKGHVWHLLLLMSMSQYFTILFLLWRKYMCLKLSIVHGTRMLRSVFIHSFFMIYNRLSTYMSNNFSSWYFMILNAISCFYSKYPLCIHTVEVRKVSQVRLRLLLGQCLDLSVVICLYRWH